MAGRRAAGARPPSARSQHFLRTRTLAAELVRDACVGADDVVVDLGAGSGRLTAELARVAKRVLAVELDPHWAARLRGRWQNVEVVEGDAALARLPRESFRVVANLPFDRTTDLLHLLLDDPGSPLVRADVIVEWGVACKRGLPWPSTQNGIFWGAFYETSVARRLPRSAFEPPPAVDAGVLVFRRRAEPLVAPELAGSYRQFVAGGFRRGLRAVSTGHAVRRIAGRGALARELDAHQWAELFLDRPRRAAGR
ncbi:MAG: methyltransferase domain-containing protein [Actinobacteria bacterium]|nr:methyltransferase domain-containing protein [Actinomycetota bacterium]